MHNFSKQIASINFIPKCFPYLWGLKWIWCLPSAVEKWNNSNEGMTFLLINHTWSFDIFLFEINSLAQLILRWHSWIAHVVTLFFTKATSLPLPTIYRLMCSSGRGNVGSPILCILLSQKLVLVKVVTLHIPIIGKWIIRDGGAKNGYNTNTMECGEQTIYCAFEEYGLEWYSLFSMDPP